MSTLSAWIVSILLILMVTASSSTGFAIAPSGHKCPTINASSLGGEISFTTPSGMISDNPNITNCSWTFELNWNQSLVVDLLYLSSSNNSCLQWSQVDGMATYFPPTNSCHVFQRQKEVCVVRDCDVIKVEGPVTIKLVNGLSCDVINIRYNISEECGRPDPIPTTDTALIVGVAVAALVLLLAVILLLILFARRRRKRRTTQVDRSEPHEVPVQVEHAAPPAPTQSLDPTYVNLQHNDVKVASKFEGEDDGGAVYANTSVDVGGEEDVYVEPKKAEDNVYMNMTFSR